MKQANRHGDIRVNIFRVGDALKIGGKFYKIANLRSRPSFAVDLTPAGAKLDGALSDGQLAVGTMAAPTEGARIEVEEIVPIEDDEYKHLVMAFVGVEMFEHQYAALTELKSMSCDVRYFMTAETPGWLTPEGENHATIDAFISPWDDPNELFPIFVKKDQNPHFQAINRYNVVLPCAIKITPIVELLLEAMTETPAAFRELSETECKGLS